MQPGIQARSASANRVFGVLEIVIDVRASFLPEIYLSIYLDHNFQLWLGSSLRSALIKTLRHPSSAIAYTPAYTA